MGKAFQYTLWPPSRSAFQSLHRCCCFCKTFFKPQPSVCFFGRMSWFQVGCWLILLVCWIGVWSYDAGVFVSPPLKCKACWLTECWNVWGVEKRSSLRLIVSQQCDEVATARKQNVVKIDLFMVAKRLRSMMMLCRIDCVVQHWQLWPDSDSVMAKGPLWKEFK